VVDPACDIVLRSELFGSIFAGISSAVCRSQDPERSTHGSSEVFLKRQLAVNGYSDDLDRGSF
jgi:hypothetical protein